MSILYSDIKLNNANVSTLSIGDSIPSVTSNTVYNSNSCISLNNNYMSMFPKSIQVVTSNSYVDIPDGTTGINIKMVGSGGGGGGQGVTATTDTGGGGGSGSYTEVFLNASTFDASSTFPNRNKIYIDIGSGGGSGGLGTGDGTNGGNTIARFANSSDVANDLIATTFGGEGGVDGNNFSLCGDGGNNGTISIGIGYTIPGQPGQNGRDSGTTQNLRLGTLGGDSLLGNGGRGNYYGYNVSVDSFDWSSVDTTSGTTWTTPGNDDFETINSVDFVFYNNLYSTFYLGTNGYITFSSSDTDSTQSLAKHFGKTRISFFYYDFDPSSSGTIKYYNNTTDNIFTYTFIDVPGFTQSNSNNIQVRLYLKDHEDSGKIEVIYGIVNQNVGIVGLSPSTNGTPSPFTQLDFNSSISSSNVYTHPTNEYLGTFNLSNTRITYTPVKVNGVKGGGGGGGSMNGLSDNTISNFKGTDGGDGAAIITFY